MSVTVSKDKEAQLVGSAEEKSKERMPLEASENPESAKTKKSKKKKKKKAKDASSDQDGRNVSLCLISHQITERNVNSLC